MELKDFKNSLGVPNEGVHKERIYGYAKIDVYGTAFFLSVIFLLIIAVPWYFILDLSKLDTINTLIYWVSLYIFSLVVMFSYGILMHRLFRVNTTLNTQIFGIL